MNTVENFVEELGNVEHKVHIYADFTRVTLPSSYVDFHPSGTERYFMVGDTVQEVTRKAFVALHSKETKSSAPISTYNPYDILPLE